MNIWPSTKPIAGACSHRPVGGSNGAQRRGYTMMNSADGSESHPYHLNQLSILKTKDFASDAEVFALVEAFESATIPPSQFTHAAHIAVALSYLAQFPLAEAQTRMREVLLHFTEHNHLVDLYHETLTTFWMRLLDHLASSHYREVPLWRRINLIVTRWGTAAPVEAHYSRELIKSKAAREEWIPPDRLPIPF